MLNAIDTIRESIRESNLKMEYPIAPKDFFDEYNIRIQLEASQHRFLAIEKIFVGNEDE